MGFHDQIAITQVSLKVTDLVQSLTFYVETLGLHVLKQRGNVVTLTADGKTPLLYLEQPEEIRGKEPRTSGLYHFALLVPLRSDLANIIIRLAEASYPLQGAADHLVSEAVYLADPDGNGIELYVDRPSSTWSWEENMVAMTTERLDLENLVAESTSERKGLPPTTIMGHIHLHVSQLDEAEAFYVNGLGFDVVQRYGGQAVFLSKHGYHHHIGINTWNGIGAKPPVDDAVGMKWYKIVFPDEETKGLHVKKLKQIGAQVEERAGGVVETSDPSGNVIYLDVRN